MTYELWIADDAARVLVVRRDQHYPHRVDVWQVDRPDGARFTDDMRAWHRGEGDFHPDALRVPTPGRRRRPSRGGARLRRIRRGLGTDPARRRPIPGLLVLGRGPHPCTPARNSTSRQRAGESSSWSRSRPGSRSHRSPRRSNVTLLRISWPGLAAVVLALHFLPPSVLSYGYPHYSGWFYALLVAGWAFLVGLYAGLCRLFLVDDEALQLEEGPRSSLDELLTREGPLDNPSRLAPRATPHDPGAPEPGSAPEISTPGRACGCEGPPGPAPETAQRSAQSGGQASQGGRPIRPGEIALRSESGRRGPGDHTGTGQPLRPLAPSLRDPPNRAEASPRSPTTDPGGPHERHHPDHHHSRRDRRGHDRSRRRGRDADHPPAPAPGPARRPSYW